MKTIPPWVDVSYQKRFTWRVRAKTRPTTGTPVLTLYREASGLAYELAHIDDKGYWSNNLRHYVVRWMYIPPDKES